jgi:hypothetical protein
MSQSDKKMPLRIARGYYYQRILPLFAPVCDKVELGGSAWRGKSECGDLEVIVIPKFGRNPNTLQLETSLPLVSLLEVELNSLIHQGKFVRSSRAKKTPIEFGKNPRFFMTGAQSIGYDNKLDLYISTPERWAVELAIKRGNFIFAQALVTHKSKGGLLPDNCRIDKDENNGKAWQIFQNDELLSFVDERDFVEFCVGRYVEPHERELSHWSELSGLSRRIYSANAKVAA